MCSLRPSRTRRTETVLGKRTCRGASVALLLCYPERQWAAAAASAPAAPAVPAEGLNVAQAGFELDL